MVRRASLTSRATAIRATRATAGVFLVLVLALVGCAARTAGTAASPAAAQAFGTEEQKLLACLDLRDHIVELYANEYVSREGLAMSTEQRTAFRDGWAEELAKRGTFDRFEQSCFVSLTPSKYRCGMASQTTDGLVACMKLGSG
ncbi:MAG TPA: hypothetical protein VE987_02995 [Polyangiaceae bacterium]|nr:hypothetical protein [Polyangiaceae bacterium]